MIHRLIPFLLALLVFLAPADSAQSLPLRPFEITEPGQTFEGRTFTRQVDIRADRTTFVRCTFDVGRAWFYCVRIHLRDRADATSSYRLSRFVDCTFRNAQKKAVVGAWMSIEGTDVRAGSSTIEECGQDGVFIDRAGFTEVRGVLFRNLGWAPGAHADGVQMGGGSNVRIVGNRFELPHVGGDGPVSNSCVFIESDEPVERVTIASNWLDGGLYSLWVIGNSTTGTAPPSHVTIRGNAFGRHFYGPHRLDTHTPGEIARDNDMSRAAKWSPELLPAPVPVAPGPKGGEREPQRRRCAGRRRGAQPLREVA